MAYNLSRENAYREAIAILGGSTTLTDAVVAIAAERVSLGKTFLCPKCGGTGTLAYNQTAIGAGSTDTTPVDCDMTATNNAGTVRYCDGWGYLEEQFGVIQQVQQYGEI